MVQARQARPSSAQERQICHWQGRVWMAPALPDRPPGTPNSAQVQPKSARCVTGKGEFDGPSTPRLAPGMSNSAQVQSKSARCVTDKEESARPDWHQARQDGHPNLLKTGPVRKLRPTHCIDIFFWIYVYIYMYISEVGGERPTGKSCFVFVFAFALRAMRAMRACVRAAAAAVRV